MYFVAIFFNSKRMKYKSTIRINFHQIMTMNRRCPFNLQYISEKKFLIEIFLPYHDDCFANFGSTIAVIYLHGFINILYIYFYVSLCSYQITYMKPSLFYMPCHCTFIRKFQISTIFTILFCISILSSHSDTLIKLCSKLAIRW